MDIITSCTVGNNDVLMHNAMRMYAQKGDVVADVTYGKGTFWKLHDVSKYDFRPSDIATGTDCRHLPYEDYEIDVLILDPPYMNRSKAPLREDFDGYLNNNREEIGEKAVLKLYFDAMREAHRVLAINGILMVKCMDQVEAGRQCWGHIDIFNYATQQLGMEGIDMLILMRVGKPPMRHDHQLHTRKNHSYLWVFGKK